MNENNRRVAIFCSWRSGDEPPFLVDFRNGSVRTIA